jgi:hypothetical protein
MVCCETLKGMGGRKEDFAIIGHEWERRRKLKFRGVKIEICLFLGV